MSDLTIIYLTANKLPEHFANFQRKILTEAVSSHELISISRIPMDFGKNILDTGEKSHLNMYLQMLNAAKVATTPYIASAEDDVLYPAEHFNFYRPPLDTFAYNMHRWSLYTWKSNFFSMKRRKSNCTLIAPRELFIEAWEERFARHPYNQYPLQWVGEVGRNNLETWLGVTLRKNVEVWSETGVIHFNHFEGTDITLGTRKKPGEVKAIEIPFWGRAEDIAKEYH